MTETERNHMRAIAIATLILLAAAAPAAMSQERPPGGPRPPMPAISVTGSGTAAGRPDTAEVMTGVITQGPTAAAALAQNSAVVEKVLKAVKALGIADRDIQTSSINVTPQRRQGGRQEAYPPDIVGYEVSNQLRVKVRDIGGLGRLLDEMVAQGANNLGGIRFSVADPAPLLDQARQMAVADARRKAEVYATAAGVKLGRLLSIRESSAMVPRPEAFQMRAMAPAAVPVATGEQEYQASVDVTYALE
jgi:uncharacterized protein YggE